MLSKRGADGQAVRIPVDSSRDVQASVQDIKDALHTLEAKYEAVKTALEELEQQNQSAGEDEPTANFVEFKEEAVFEAGLTVGVNDLHVVGDGLMVPGFERFLREDGKWVNVVTPFRESDDDPSQKYNLDGHVHVAGGLYCSKVTAGDADIFGDARVHNLKRDHSRIAVNEDSETLDRWLGQPDRRLVSVHDDFVHSGNMVTGNIGTLNWSFYTSGSVTVNAHAGAANNPGALYWSGYTATTVGSLYANTAAYTTLNGIEEYWQTFIIREHAGAVGDLDGRWGLMDNVTYATTDNGIYFYLDASAGASATNYVARTFSASSNTDTDTGVAFAGTGWINFDIHYTPSSVKFYIEKALVATHTTNIPTVNNMMPCISGRYAGTTRSWPFLDYYAFTYKVDRSA